MCVLKYCHVNQPVKGLMCVLKQLSCKSARERVDVCAETTVM